MGVTGVKWYVDDREVASDYNGAPWTKAWDSRTVADGSHRIFAKARDAVGHWTTSAKFNFAVRNAVTKELETTIDAGPAVTNDTTPDFSFSSSQPGSTFECAVDGGSFVGVQVAGDACRAGGGPHVFAVRAINSGTTDPTPASQAFTIDTIRPRSRSARRWPARRSPARSL